MANKTENPETDHTHACDTCGAAVPCGGDRERNHDGWPSVICVVFHDHAREPWLCEPCGTAEAAQARLDEAENLANEDVSASDLLRRALPLLVLLGNYLGNGPIAKDRPDSLGSRCDLIGDIHKYLDGAAS
jgi:hypothetical protein